MNCRSLIGAVSIFPCVSLMARSQRCRAFYWTYVSCAFIDHFVIFIFASSMFSKRRYLNFGFSSVWIEIFAFHKSICKSIHINNLIFLLLLVLASTSNLSNTNKNQVHNNAKISLNPFLLYYATLGNDQFSPLVSSRHWVDIDSHLPAQWT